MTMTTLLLVLARVFHIFGGVIWAGSMFALSFGVMPVGAQHAAEGSGRWTGLVMRRLGPASGISAIVTVLSGFYLFATLHSGDHSVSGMVLGTGAAAGVLSLLVGVLIGRPAGLRLSQLQMNPAGADKAQLASLQRRAAVSSRVAGILLGLAVLSMAAFRYAGAL
jgi:uncharacterized membrane protein